MKKNEIPKTPHTCAKPRLQQPTPNQRSVSVSCQVFVRSCKVCFDIFPGVRTRLCTRFASFEMKRCLNIFLALPLTTNVVDAFALRPISFQPQTKEFYTRKGGFGHREGAAHSRENGALFQSSLGVDSNTPNDSLSPNSEPPTAQKDAAAMAVSLQTVQQNEDIQTKIFNALLLAACFGFAAYTILNIDNGMTRGWTQSEIAMRIPLDNWLNYESSLADRPVATKTAINVIIYLLGDWLSQTAFSGKNVLDFNAARTLRNGFIGLCFGPLVHEYYQFSDYILPVDGGMWIRLQKILMDQTIYLSVKCSIYISAVGLLQGDNVATVRDNVQTKLPKIVLTAWKFWPLVHLVTYGVIPARHRILWVNCVDLVWNAILATMSQKKDVVEEEEPMLLEATISEESNVLAAMTYVVEDAPLLLEATLPEGTNVVTATVSNISSSILIDKDVLVKGEDDDKLVAAGAGEI
jgi:protein Mpv17